MAVSVPLKSTSGIFVVDAHVLKVKWVLWSLDPPTVTRSRYILGGTSRALRHGGIQAQLFFANKRKQRSECVKDERQAIHGVLSRPGPDRFADWRKRGCTMGVMSWQLGAFHLEWPSVAGSAGQSNTVRNIVRLRFCCYIIHVGLRECTVGSLTVLLVVPN